MNNAESELLLKTLSSLENRLETLETKVAYQDDTIEQLNGEITTLNLSNAMMQRQLKLLAEKVKDTKSSAVASESEETPPPHY